MIGSAPIAMPPTRSGMSPRKQLEHPLADQPRPLRIERDLAAIEVVVRLLAGGEREVAKSQGLVANQLLQCIRGRTWR